MPTTITRTSLLAMMAVAVAIAVIFAAGARLALADQDQAPTGLTLAVTDANTVQATWTAHPDGARDYRLSWAPHDENFKTWTDTDWNAFPTGNSYAITGLEGGSTYKVKVRARFETGPPSHWSGIVTATTTAPPEPTPAPTPQPTPEPTPEAYSRARNRLRPGTKRIGLPRRHHQRRSGQPGRDRGHRRPSRLLPLLADPPAHGGTPHQEARPTTPTSTWRTTTAP